MLTLLLLLFFALVVWRLARQGIWAAVLMLFNVTVAGLIATNFFEPLAALLQQAAYRGGYFWDFLSLWMIFAAALLVLRLFTDMLSRVRLKFSQRVDLIGGCFFAAWTSWMLLCFLLMSLHTAPLSRTFLKGGFDPESHMFLRLSPDRVWLGLMQQASRGSLSRTPPENDPDRFVFDPD